jgi:hypothetical protein
MGDVPIRFLARPLDVGDNATRSEFVEVIRDEEQVPRLIVIDTLARCFGAGDENSTKDMSAFVASLNAIREAFLVATILVVHHAGKSAGKGERGSTALRGAADTVMSLAGSGDWLTLKCEKQKDAEQFSPIAFKLSPVALPNGKSSCVIEIGPSRSGARDVMPKLRKSDRRALEALQKAGGTGASFTEWREASKLRPTSLRMRGGGSWIAALSSKTGAFIALLKLGRGPKRGRKEAGQPRLSRDGKEGRNTPP